MKKLRDYSPIIGMREISELQRMGEALEEKTLAHVSSTFYGGGVAEMLSPLILLMNDVGLKTEWRIFRGSPDFFAVTKKMHNALQGDVKIRLNKPEIRLYEETAEDNTRYMSLEGYDCVVVHDPQPAPLINYYHRKVPWMFKPLPIIIGLKTVQKTQPWIWRCHVDLTNPNPAVWNYLQRFVSKYDAAIVSMEQYGNAITGGKPKYVIRPAIDPLSAKNLPMSEEKAESILEKYGISCKKPIIAQVSRFDRWKDPLGVIETYKLVKKKADCKLILLGNTATDDPEGDSIYKQTIMAAEGDEDVYAISLQSDELVNAVQTISKVVIQKSLREGFGLTVSEALWKGTPVVASAVGGMPLQVIDGNNGFLVNGPEECAEKTIWLLKHPKEAKRMGANGREHVRSNFLITRLLKDYLSMMQERLYSHSMKIGGRRVPGISHAGYHVSRAFKAPANILMKFGKALEKAIMGKEPK